MNKINICIRCFILALFSLFSVAKASDSVGGVREVSQVCYFSPQKNLPQIVEDYLKLSKDFELEAIEEITDLETATEHLVFRLTPKRNGYSFSINVVFWRLIDVPYYQLDELHFSSYHIWFKRNDKKRSDSRKYEDAALELFAKLKQEIQVFEVSNPCALRS